MHKHTNILPFVGETWITPLYRALTIFKNEIAPVLRSRNIELEKEGKKVTPEENSVFRAFNQTPFDSVRVVVVGQDPYPTRGDATGLAFDVPRSRKLAASLRNILNEIRTDVGESVAEGNESSYLEHLPAQGVLLLNKALTTDEGAMGAHIALWKSFLAETVGALNKRPHLVWVLWGKKAQELMPLINPDHSVIIGPHPSPFSFKPNPKTGAPGFEGGKYFSKINALIKGTTITW